MTKPVTRIPARQRAAEQRAAAERRRRRTRALATGGALAGVVVLAAAVVAIVLGSIAAGAADARGRTTAAPWPAPTDVEQRVRDAGLTMLSAEGTALHIHQHLAVTVDGKPVTVPAGLGIDEAAQQISPIHTHDTTGIIHVESAEVRRFFLRQVFAEWDVRLAKGSIGAYVEGSDGVRMAVWVDGRRYTGDPGAIALTAHEDIDIAVTTDGTAPAAPTAHFTFPAGY